MEIRYVDAHCHVQFSAYDEDRDELLARMRAEGVVGIVVGCDVESSAQAVALAGAHEHLYAAVGHHPNHLEPFDEAAIRALLADDKVVAVGECGLDYYRPQEVTPTVVAAQKELFKKHVALAAEFRKPLIIHARPSKGTMDAYHDLTQLLREAKQQHPDLSGDVHFFVGGTNEADALVALGFSVSFTAVLTFARDYDAVVRHVPIGSMLAETDAPYVAPQSRRGQRNDPLSVIEVVRTVAQVRNEDPEAVRVALLENARRLFSIT